MSEEVTKKTQKVFIIPTTGMTPIGRDYLAVSESFVILARHFCSHDGWALIDLGSPERIRFYQHVHPDGLLPEFEFISDSDHARYFELYSKVINKACESLEQKIGRNDEYLRNESA